MHAKRTLIWTQYALLYHMHDGKMSELLVLAVVIIILKFISCKLTLNFGLFAYSNAVYFPIPLEHPVMRTIVAMLSKDIFFVTCILERLLCEALWYCNSATSSDRSAWVLETTLSWWRSTFHIPHSPHSTFQLSVPHFENSHTSPHRNKNRKPYRPEGIISTNEKYFLFFCDRDHSRFSSPRFCGWCQLFEGHPSLMRDTG